jgi:hypothetical protein
MELPIPFGNDLDDVEVGPLDGDVFDDVVVGEAGSVHVYLSVGDGTLAKVAQLGVGGTDDLLLAHLDPGIGDDLDLLVADSAGGAVRLLEGQGNGTFAPLLPPILVPEGPRGLAVAPVPGDDLGIVVTTQATAVGVRVFVPAGPGYAPAPQGFVPLPGEFAGRPVVIPPGDLFALPDVLVFTIDAQPGPVVTHVARLRMDPSVPGNVDLSSEDWEGAFVAEASVADVDLDGRADLVLVGLLESLDAVLDVRFGL